jgi:hypothetical protein
MAARRWKWLVLASLALGAGPAQAGVSFTVSPMTLELSAQAGKPATGVITVTHDLPPGAKPAELPPLRLRAYVQDWTIDRKGQPTFGKPGSIEGSCSEWMEVSPTDLVVPAGERREVRYTVRVPASVQGTFRTVVMFETAPEPRKEGARTISVTGRVGSTMYVQVGPQSKRARITGFKVTPEKSTIVIENTGTSHVRLNGNLQFKDDSGRLVKQVPVRGGVVLPGRSNVREVEVDTPKLPDKGKYSVTAVIDYGGEVLVGARAQVTVP